MGRRKNHQEKRDGAKGKRLNPSTTFNECMASTGSLTSTYTCPYKLSFMHCVSSTGVLSHP